MPQRALRLEHRLVDGTDLGVGDAVNDQRPAQRPNLFADQGGKKISGAFQESFGKARTGARSAFESLGSAEGSGAAL